MYRQKAILAVCIFFLAFIHVSFVKGAGFEIGPAGSFGGWIDDMTVSGNYAFLARGTGITVLDISNPQNPVRKTSVSLPHEPRAIAVSENYLYAVVPSDGLYVIDITNPLNPSIAGSTGEKFDSWGDMKIAVSGNYAYVAARMNGNQALYTFNIATPSSPILDSTTHGGVSAVKVSDNRAYVLSTQPASFQIIDISDPANPEPTASYTFNLTEPRDIFVSGGRAWVLDRENNSDSNCYLHGFDISSANPANTVHLGKVNTTHCNSHIYVNGDYAYLAGGEYVTVVNTTKFDQSGSETGSYSVDKSSGQWTAIEAVFAAGDYVYIAVSSNASSFQTIDISNPASPSKTGEFLSPGDLYQAIASGSRLYVSDAAGLFVYDRSQPEAPAFLGYMNPGDQIKRMFVDGTNVYLLLEQTKKVLIVNAANPAAMVTAGEYSLPSGRSFTGINPVYVKNNSLYLLDGKDMEKYLEILDVNNPATPQQSSDVLLLASGRAVLVSDNTAYVAVENENIKGIFLFNISNPANPVLLNQEPVSTEAKPNCLSIDGNTLFAGSNYTDPNYQNPSHWYLEAFDVSNPESVSRIAETGAEGAVLWGAEVQSGYIFAALSGGCVHAFEVDTSGFTEKGVCPSPSSIGITTTPPDSSGYGYIYTPEGYAEDSTGYSYYSGSDGLYTQRFKPEVKEPVLTLSAGTSNPAPNKKVYSVSSETGYVLTPESLSRLDSHGLPADVSSALQSIKNNNYTSVETFYNAVKGAINDDNLTAQYKDLIFKDAMSIWAENVPIAHIVLTANQVDDWTVTSVSFKASGTGNEKHDEDVVEARLYLNGIGGTLLGMANYTADDGTISFSMSQKIPKGSSISMTLVYDFNGEKACPCDTFQVNTDMSKITATPDNYSVYKKLPVPPDGVTGGPTRIKMGTLTIVDGNNQYGTPNKPDDNPKIPLAKPLTAQVGWEDPACVDYAEFLLSPPNNQFGAFFQTTAPVIR